MTGLLRCAACSVVVVLAIGCADDGPAGEGDDGTGPAPTSAADDGVDDGDGSGTLGGTGLDDGGTQPTGSGDGDGGSTAAATGSATGSDDGGTASGDDGTASDGGGASTGDDGGSTTGEPPSGTVCTSDDDCQLADDCCQCAALHVEDDSPMCDMECDTTVCEAAGLAGIDVQCRFGACELVPVTCNGDILFCDSEPPPCPEGFLPSTDERCWTGDCVPAQACDVVPDCTWCPAGDTCVNQITQIGPFYSCEPIDPSCDGQPTCECMGEVCSDPFECVMADATDLACVCPVC